MWVRRTWAVPVAMLCGLNNAHGTQIPINVSPVPLSLVQADIRYGLKPEDLRVAEAHIGTGKIEKRLKIHGRGKQGIVRKRWSHLRVVLQVGLFVKPV